MSSPNVAKQQSPEKGSYEAIMAGAMNWLDIVGRYVHELPKPDTPYNRAHDNVMRELADRINESDFDTAALLSTLERESIQERSGISDIEDEILQRTVRTTGFYGLARVMNRYAGLPFDNSSSPAALDQLTQRESDLRYFGSPNINRSHE